MWYLTVFRNVDEGDDFRVDECPLRDKDFRLIREGQEGEAYFSSLYMFASRIPPVAWPARPGGFDLLLVASSLVRQDDTFRDTGMRG